MNFRGNRTAARSSITLHPLTAVRRLSAGDDDHRAAKLQDQLELLDEHLTDRDEWIERYVQTVSPADYDCGSSDAERFLEWLRQHRPLSVAENDAVCCQSARFAVAAMVKLNPTRHLRFQEMWSEAPLFSRDLPRFSKFWFVVNPIHVWTTLRSSALLHAADGLPAQVVFFPVQTEVRSAVVTPLGQRFLRHLSETAACRWDDLLQVCRPEKPIDVLHLCRELTSIGLLSLG
ncbi:MAG: hypothetical protein WEB58_20825 [Planctomycetaceae bacterium]